MEAAARARAVAQLLHQEGEDVIVLLAGLVLMLRVHGADARVA